MPMTRWEFSIVPCLAGGNASATCLKMLVMRFADVQCLRLCFCFTFLGAKVMIRIIIITYIIVCL